MCSVARWATWGRPFSGKGLLFIAGLLAVTSLTVAVAALPRPDAAPWPATWHQSYSDRIATAQLLIAALASAGVLMAVIPTLVRAQRLNWSSPPHRFQVHRSISSGSRTRVVTSTTSGSKPSSFLLDGAGCRHGEVAPMRSGNE